mgnify:CR=1 FL=1
MTHLALAFVLAIAIPAMPKDHILDDASLLSDDQRQSLAELLARVGQTESALQLLGAVPVAGDLFDFLYSSNTRNLKIVRRHLDKHHPCHHSRHNYMEHRHQRDLQLL